MLSESLKFHTPDPLSDHELLILWSQTFESPHFYCPFSALTNVTISILLGKHLLEILNVMLNLFVYNVVSFSLVSLPIHRYTQGTGRIWLDNLHCTSSDIMLSTCTHNGLGIEDCSHSEDVAVSCSSSLSTIAPSKSQGYKHTQLVGFYTTRGVGPFIQKDFSHHKYILLWIKSSFQLSILLAHHWLWLPPAQTLWHDLHQ